MSGFPRQGGGGSIAPGTVAQQIPQWNGLEWVPQALPFTFAATNGILADGLDHGAALNSLITAVSTIGGGAIYLPPGNVMTSVPIVSQANVWLVGPGSVTGASGIRLLPNSGCDVFQRQCYVPTANAWSSASVVYTAGTIVTYLGHYYLCTVGYTSSASPTPDIDYFHWTVFSPTSTGAQASGDGLVNLTLHGGWAHNQPNGDIHHGLNFADTSGGPDFRCVNVGVKGTTGDSKHENYGSALLFGQGRYMGCTFGQCGLTALMLNDDSEYSNCNAAYAGLGGVLQQRGSTVGASVKANNVGVASIFKATRQVTDGVTNGTTALSSATANWTSDDIGQGIYDGATPGAGDIPALTYIVDVLDAQHVTLSQAATGSHTGLTTNIAGYYFQPQSNSVTGAMSPIVIGPNDGIAYVLLVASVTGLSTNPSGDTTNWRPIRTAYEWGVGHAFQGATCANNSWSGIAQTCLRAAWQLNATGSSSRGQGILTVASSNNGVNPRTGRYLYTIPTTPTNLMAPALMQLQSSNGWVATTTVLNNVLNGGTPILGLMNWPSGTSNAVTVTSDGQEGWYVGTAAAGGVAGSLTVTPQAIPVGTATTRNVCTINGVGWGISAVDPATLAIGPQGPAGAVCLGSTIGAAGRFIGGGLAAAAPGSGSLRVAPLRIPPGVLVSNVTVATTAATTASGTTHVWAAVFAAGTGTVLGGSGAAGALLANSTDSTTPPGNSAVVDYAMATPYVTTDPVGEYYVGFVHVNSAGQQPTMLVTSNTTPLPNRAPTTGVGNAAATTPAAMTVPTGGNIAFGIVAWVS